jgi:hypothetical protein
LSCAVALFISIDTFAVIHNTIMGLTAATGKPILCVVIFKSENEHSIPHQWVSGIDITKMRNNEDFNNLNNDEHFLRENIGKVKCLPYYPECLFHGKEVP